LRYVERQGRKAALRGLLSSASAVKAIQISEEEIVREAVANAIIAFKTASGSYEIRNRFRYVIATA
jgi:hypothetical protein